MWGKGAVFLIYITGDTHGDLSRFKTKEARAIRKGDTLIVCGDFGFLWEGGDAEARRLRWLGKRRYNICFVEGPNDNMALLSRFPEAVWNGGRVREISGRLRYLCRGEIFHIDGCDIFAFGGGAPPDDAPRPEGWAGGELPAPDELANARQNLERARYRVDYIVTHQPSRKIRHFIDTDRHGAGSLARCTSISRYHRARPRCFRRSSKPNDSGAWLCYNMSGPDSSPNGSSQESGISRKVKGNHPGAGRQS